MTKKIPWHVEALIVTPLVLLKRSWRDKSQNTIKMILTVTKVCHTSHSKVNESQYIWITHVAHFGDRLWSFFLVVEFVSSISFKWYRWCHRQSFDVFIEFFLFPCNFLFLFFIVNCASLFLEFERVANNIYNLWIAYIICDFLYFSIYFLYCIGLSKFFSQKC